jgi:hypothetical protein
MCDPIDAVMLAAGQEELKREYLVDFGHCIIFVACFRDKKTGGRTFMTNDVTRWYVKDQAA